MSGGGSDMRPALTHWQRLASTRRPRAVGASPMRLRSPEHGRGAHATITSRRRTALATPATSLPHTFFSRPSRYIDGRRIDFSQPTCAPAHRTEVVRMDAKHSLGEPRLLISRSALLHNVAVLRRHLAPGVKLCAMIKADAYGHGAAIVADSLANLAPANAADTTSPAADQLAVATIDEAAQLSADVALPVMIMRQV